jgi:hypothetical protein
LRSLRSLPAINSYFFAFSAPFRGHSSD